MIEETERKNEMGKGGRKGGKEGEELEIQRDREREEERGEKENRGEKRGRRKEKREREWGREKWERGREGDGYTNRGRETDGGKMEIKIAFVPLLLLSGMLHGTTNPLLSNSMITGKLGFHIPSLLQDSEIALPRPWSFCGSLAGVQKDMVDS